MAGASVVVEKWYANGGLSLDALSVQLADLHAASACGAWSKTSWRDALISPVTETWIARLAGDGGAITAAAHFAVVLDEAELLQLFTRPRARGAGVARLLLVQAFTDFASRSLRFVYLDVARDNLAAISLYDTLGFHTFAVRERYYRQSGEKPIDALQMRIAL